METLKKLFSANLYPLEIGFKIFLVVVCYLLWQRLYRALHIKTEQSANRVDDILLRAVYVPGTALIILIGLQQVGLSFLEYASSLDLTSAMLEKLREALGVAHRFIIILFLLFWFVLRLISGFEDRYRRSALKIKDKEIDSGTATTIFKGARFTVIIIAALTLMDAVGISINSILAFGGIGGIIIGFAAKDTLTNFFSGMLIFWERPFVVNDWIRCPDHNIEGVVEDIGWRMTQIRTFDRRPLYVPNSLFFSSVIENPQRMTSRRLYETMGLRYDDIDRLPAVLTDIRQMVQDHSGIDNEQIQMVNFSRYGDSSLEFFIYAMTTTTKWQQFNDIREDIFLKVADIVRQHGCEFAYPTQTLHIVPPQPTATATAPPGGQV